MPTAVTTTTTAASSISLKGSPEPSSAPSSSTVATLRSLYPRAARAFLQRDVILTDSLLSSGLSLINPPASRSCINDSLASHRRKWDILRLTFETTLYASPPSTQDSLPSALRANLILSPEPLITSLHTRSLQLFTPSDHPQKPSSAFLPAQILVTLVLASLKLDSAEVGRRMIEEWLARHGQEPDMEDPTGYAKVLELYCLHVLPRLQDWDYAEDFLAYESELPHQVRYQLEQSLRQLCTEAASAEHVQTALPSSPSLASSSSGSSTPSRTPSPAVSDDSSQSSSSTHTAIPLQSQRGPPALTPLTPSGSHSQSPTPRADPHSASSASIASTATSRTITPLRTPRRAKPNGTAHPNGAANGSAHANGHAYAQRSPSSSTRAGARSRSSTPASGSGMSAALVPRTPSRGSVGEASASPASARPPSTLALVRAALGSLARGTSRAQVLFYVVVFVVLPVASFLARTAAGAGSAVDAVRRRLRGTDGAGGGVAARVWAELVRAVLDTVNMAGRGLV
ncbi:uncharacterized protein BXZ73DRAFT_86609 [Epithele typhae]|uniref:uncharacterized protein n=1 Tax=Epithele typhae TaxID=378194 RepID=UPI00200743C5|nr:uncharacterized protein BXZ73DRAFT_86609 [Epithele typhae]KAH9945034.1 hypothetical protein BXZ73DRAFT_86609 [Epithele typhae]